MSLFVCVVIEVINITELPQGTHCSRVNTFRFVSFANILAPVQLFFSEMINFRVT